jgi:hypothetical protein
LLIVKFASSALRGGLAPVSLTFRALLVASALFHCARSSVNLALPNKLVDSNFCKLPGPLDARRSVGHLRATRAFSVFVSVLLNNQQMLG